jgi:hypothetical protein
MPPGGFQTPQLLFEQPLDVPDLGLEYAGTAGAQKARWSPKAWKTEVARLPCQLCLTLAKRAGALVPYLKLHPAFA